MLRTLRLISALIAVMLFMKPALAQEKNASLGGLVTDADGNALPAEIRVYQEKAEEGFSNFGIACSVITSSDGVFTCPELTPNRYIVQALPVPSRHPELSVGSKSDWAIPPSVFFPKSATVESAEFVTLSAEQSEWLGIIVPSVHLTSIAGILVDRPATALFDLQSASDRLQIATPAVFNYDPTTGRFQAENIAVGHYILMAKWTLANRQRQVALPLDVGQTAVTNLNLNGTSTVEISGQVEGADTDVHLRLQNIEGNWPDSVASSHKSRFQFQPVPTGKYAMLVDSPRALYVDHSTVDGKETSGASILLAAEGKTTIVVSLATPSQNITGSVESCGQSRKCRVIALEEASNRIATAVTDANGKFAIDGLTAGDYRLWAWTEIAAIPYRNPRVLQKFARDSTEIHIENNGIKEPVHLRLITSQ